MVKERRVENHFAFGSTRGALIGPVGEEEGLLEELLFNRLRPVPGHQLGGSFCICTPRRLPTVVVLLHQRIRGWEAF